MYTFKVQGNSGVYDVVIGKKGTELIATCTCANANKGRACSHRRSILNGYDDKVIENKHQVKEIKSLLAGITTMMIPDEMKKTIESSSIKAEKVKNEKIFYFERENDESSWVRIGRSDFDRIVTNNREYAIEVQTDSDDCVTFMRYVKNSELVLSNYGIQSIDQKGSDAPYSKRIYSLKVTITKNGTPYFYERSGDDGYWSRIDQPFFEFLVAENKNQALETRYDDKGSIVFLRYEYDENRGKGKGGLRTVWENISEKSDGNQKKGKGCLPVLLSLTAIVLLLSSALLL